MTQFNNSTWCRCGFDWQPEIVSNRLIRHKTPAKRPRRRLDSTWHRQFDLPQPWIQPGAFYSLGGLGFNLVPLWIQPSALNCVKSTNSPQNASQKAVLEAVLEAAPEAELDLAPPI
jgi:hypothetical protein